MPTMIHIAQNARGRSVKPSQKLRPSGFWQTGRDPKCGQFCLTHADVVIWMCAPFGQQPHAASGRHVAVTDQLLIEKKSSPGSFFGRSGNPECTSPPMACTSECTSPPMSGTSPTACTSPPLPGTSPPSGGNQSGKSCSPRFSFVARGRLLDACLGTFHTQSWRIISVSIANTVFVDKPVNVATTLHALFVLCVASPGFENVRLMCVRRSGLSCKFHNKFAITMRSLGETSPFTPRCTNGQFCPHFHCRSEGMAAASGQHGKVLQCMHA